MVVHLSSAARAPASIDSPQPERLLLWPACCRLWCSRPCCWLSFSSKQGNLQHQPPAESQIQQRRRSIIQFCFLKLPERRPGSPEQVSARTGSSCCPPSLPTRQQ